MVQVQLLGAVAAFDDGGTPLDVGPTKCQALLAALALEPGAVVPVSRLVAMVWGDDPPRTAEKTLQTYVTRLRKALGEGSIVRVGHAYRLDLDRSAVDVARFEAALDRGDVAGSLAEWAGPPLAGLDAEGLGPAVDALVERWLGAVESHLAAEVDRDPAGTIAALSELVARHPFREALWGLLMTALYRTGRQADALAAYRSARQQLVDALGVEPGPSLRDLEARILAQDGSLLTEGPPAAPSTGDVTFAFVDVEDAARAWANHPHEASAAMARYEQLVQAGVDARGGRVVSRRGGSFGITFAHVDAAVSWAEELQTAVRREPWPRNVAVQARIGIHTAPAEGGAGDHLGAGANLAGSLASAGHGGQTLLSEATAALAAVGTELVDLGAQHVPDVPAPARVFQLGAQRHPPIRSGQDRRLGNLPRRARQLIGRERELQAVCEAVRASPLVTLTGPGGIGKSRLAIVAAQVLAGDFDDGAWLVELAPVGPGPGVLRAVADSLGIAEGPGRGLLDAVVRSLQDRRALVVLDNCEHVLTDATALVDALVDGCPHVVVLATSRTRLGVDGEQVLGVGPLDPMRAGAELFRARAAAADPTFDGYATRATVEDICRRLDGVPLAIELAAARATAMAPGEILERLDDALRLLADDRHGGVEHHRTLRLAVEWSYDLLSPVEQQVLQRLSTFVGHFDLRAAEAVAASDDLDALAVDDVVGRLVEQSLVLVDAGPFGRRFRLLESIRQFAAEHLRSQADARTFADRHASWCLAQAQAVHDLLAGHDEIEGVARLGELWPNLRAAVDRAIRHVDTALARALITPVAAEALVRSRTEIADWAERLLEIAPPEDEDLVVFSLALAARRYWRTQDRAGWERLVERHGAPDHPLVHHARALVEHDAEALLRWCPQAAAAVRAAGDEHLAQLSDIGVARSLLALGRFPEADPILAELTDRYRRDGPPSLLGWMLTMRGYSALAQGDPESADRLFDESAAIALPERTHTRNRPIEALALLRRGDERGALRVLLDDVEDLLGGEDVYDMGGTVVAFMSAMAHLGEHADAAHANGHLESTGQIGAPILRSLVTDAAVAIGQDPALEPLRAAGARLGGRAVLHLMRDALARQLAADDPAAKDPRGS